MSPLKSTSIVTILMYKFQHFHLSFSNIISVSQINNRKILLLNLYRSLNPYTTFVEYSKYYRYPNRTGCLLNDFSNQRVSCRDLSAIPRMDLGVWAEHYY